MRDELLRLWRGISRFFRRLKSGYTKAHIMALEADLCKSYGNVMLEMSGHPDWHYRRLPWMREALFMELTAAIPVNEYKFMTLVERSGPNGMVVRGSMVISDAGLAALRHLAAQESNQ